MNPIAILGAGAAFLYLTRKPGPGEPGYVPSADEVAALGVPPGQSNGRGSNLTAAIGGAIGAGTCIGVASYFGATAAGVAAAPLCAKGGAAAAPFVKKGAVFIGKETAKGAVLAYHTGKNEVLKTIENPLTDPINKSITITNLSQKGLHVVDRTVTAAYGKAPAPIKVVLAPVVAATKLGTKLGDLGAGAAKSSISGAKKVAGAVENTAKKAENFVSNLFSF